MTYFIIFFLIMVITSVKAVIYDGPYYRSVYWTSSYTGNNFLVSEHSFITSGYKRKYCIDIGNTPQLIVKQSGTYAANKNFYIMDPPMIYFVKVKDLSIKVRPHNVRRLPSPIYIMSVLPYTNYQPSSNLYQFLLQALSALWDFVTSKFELPVPNPFGLGSSQSSEYYIVLPPSAAWVKVVFNGQDDNDEDLQGVVWYWLVEDPSQGSYFIDVIFRSRTYIEVFGPSYPIGGEWAGSVRAVLFADFYIFDTHSPACW